MWVYLIFVLEEKETWNTQKVEKGLDLLFFCLFFKTRLYLIENFTFGI